MIERSSDRIDVQHERSRRSARARATLVRHAFRPRVLRYEACYKASYIAAVARARAWRSNKIPFNWIVRSHRVRRRGRAFATLRNKNIVNLISPLLPFSLSLCRRHLVVVLSGVRAKRRRGIRRDTAWGCIKHPFTHALILRKKAVS